jgi:ribosome-associated protein
MAESNASYWSVMDDLRITDDVTIPADELQWTFLPSGAPGGQHANRSATKVVLRFDPASSSAFDAVTRARILDRIGGMISVVADDTRSQWRNREIATHRLRQKIEEAIAPEPPPRTPTRPSRQSDEERLEEKHRQSERKRLRQPPDVDD